jgi:5-methylcytosine-specific restriction endonuclease McrA
MSRACLRCGATDRPITRDHVVPRVALRMAFAGMPGEYARFCALVRKVNIQALCSFCNNLKGDRACDYRDDERRELLVKYLVDFGLQDSIRFEVI